MKLSDLNHLMNDRRIRFNQEQVNGETVTIVCYMIGDRDLWEKPLACECRGIVFNSTGDCIARPFHKFFNIGENEQTQLHHIQDREFEILEKRDGSLLIPVMVGSAIAWKTKKSFYSEVAVEAVKNVPYEVERLSHVAIANGYTPIFEYTSPFNRIVLDYGNEPQFVLLAMRNIKTGEYLDYDNMETYAKAFKVGLITNYNTTLQGCLNQASILENFEGWCLRDPVTGFYCKLKCGWYLRNHRAQTELRERDVADMVIDETIDDIKSALALDGFDITPIEEIERKVSNELAETAYSVFNIVNSIEDKTNFKQIAQDCKDHKLFGLIMSVVRGKEPDYKKFWIQTFRDNYSLKCVYNKNF